MDIEQCQATMAQYDSDMQYVEQMSNDIVKSRTNDLDGLMSDINRDIIQVQDPDIKVLERYFLELTNALYFINPYCESLGFYEDLSKSGLKMKYNKAYSDNQISNTAKGVKTTVADNQLAAENASMTENIVSLIYSRSFRIIKVKLDAANEMVRTLSKIISSRMSERQLSSYNAPTGEDEDFGQLIN